MGLCIGLIVTFLLGAVTGVVLTCLMQIKRD